MSAIILPLLALTSRYPRSAIFWRWDFRTCDKAWAHGHNTSGRGYVPYLALCLLQRLPLRVDFVQNVIQRAWEDQDLGFHSCAGSRR